MIVLMVGLYLDKSPIRQAEYIHCLTVNAANGLIDKIIVFMEEFDAWGSILGTPLATNSKLKFESPMKRMTYEDYFSYANEHLEGHTIVLANADIHFDRTLGLLKDKDIKGQLLCLGRWVASMKGGQEHCGTSFSQDAWIFQTPIREFACDWTLGTPGCDNRLTYEANLMGVKVWNPSLSVRAWHVHDSKVRNYEQQKRIEGNTLDLDPTYLSLPKFRNKVFNTSPIIIHNPGAAYSHPSSTAMFDEIVRRVHRCPIYRDHVKINPDLTVLNWCNKDYSHASKSCDTLGIPHTVIAKDVKEGFWRNVLKIELAREWVKTATTKYVLATDATDVLILADPSPAIKLIEELHCDAVFNADSDSSWPEEAGTTEWEQKIIKRSPWRFLNAGCSIFKTDFYRFVLNEAAGMTPPHPHDDQGVFKQLYKKYYPRIRLDSECKVFQSLYKKSSVDECFEII